MAPLRAFLCSAAVFAYDGGTAVSKFSGKWFQLGWPAFTMAAQEFWERASERAALKTITSGPAK